jgi:hypothetical protein
VLCFDRGRPEQIALSEPAVEGFELRLDGETLATLLPREFAAESLAVTGHLPPDQLPLPDSAPTRETMAQQVRKLFGDLVWQGGFKIRQLSYGKFTLHEADGTWRAEDAVADLVIRQGKVGEDGRALETTTLR